MSIINFIHLETDAITENPVKIPFEFNDTGSLPEGKVLSDSIVIRPMTVRTWFRIKPLLMEISKEDYDKLIYRNVKIPDSEIRDIMTKYDNTIAQIVFIGIHNKHGEMPQWFRDVLLANCHWNDLFILLNAILFRIGQQSFCKSITTLRNVSPLTEAEIIAAQKNLESWKIPQ